MKNYYKILGIETDATQEQIKKAFKKRAFETHPDKNKGKDEEFKLVNESYQILSNAAGRRSHDAGMNIEDLFDFDIFGEKNKKEYPNIKKTRISNRHGDIWLEQSDKDVITVYGPCKISQSGSSLHLSDLSHLYDLNGRIVLSNSCSVQAECIEGRIDGSIGVGGRISVASGTIDLEICRPIRVSATVNNNYRVYSRGSFEQKSRNIFMPRGHEPKLALFLENMKGDIYLEYTGPR